ncbi:hypothetical protein [Nocardia sp. NPDC048505]|uniref:hypothetical protein n=1 Tax=unclassified Nocardia TaxID=2637762 RepID=UPI0033EBADCB
MTAVSYALGAHHVDLTRRVVVAFPTLGSAPGLVLEFAATPGEADEFACAASRIGLTVTVDHAVRTGLRPLPCRSLWH